MQFSVLFWLILRSTEKILDSFLNSSLSSYYEDDQDWLFSLKTGDARTKRVINIFIRIFCCRFTQKFRSDESAQTNSFLLTSLYLIYSYVDGDVRIISSGWSCEWPFHKRSKIPCTLTELFTDVFRWAVKNIFFSSNFSWIAVLNSLSPGISRLKFGGPFFEDSMILPWCHKHIY